MDNFIQHVFPVGYEEVHPDANLNMHLNWALSVGLIKLEDVKDFIPQIKSVKDGKKVMIELASQALSEQRILDAAFFYRFAEFFSSPQDIDKGQNFEKFTDIFYSIESTENIERINVPYEDYFLRTLHLKPNTIVKGKIVLFGGADSVAEDFLAIANYYVNRGYEVFLFEGPGQGEALYKYNKPFIIEWEKPVGVILDYFELNDVTLIGTSFGGWLVLRAAAFESRVTRVIAFDIIYDLYECFFFKKSLPARIFFKSLLRLRASFILNLIIKRQMRKDILIDWLVSFGMYINGQKDPYGYFRKMGQYNVSNQYAPRINQDILLLAGEEDHFIPVHLLEKQQKVLTNAKSVTGRIFTQKDQAEQHCQVGNIKLALDVMIDWIEAKTVIATEKGRN
jgi:pimeloyl-ACP methyl ester carboxylesterase